MFIIIIIIIIIVKIIVQIFFSLSSPSLSLTLTRMQCLKKKKCLNLINEISRNYRCVRFVNVSMRSLGVFSDERSTFLLMMNDIGIDKKQQLFIIKKIINKVSSL